MDPLGFSLCYNILKRFHLQLLRYWGPVTSFKMAAILAAILDFTENKKLLKKTLKIGYFDAGHLEYHIIKHFAAFC